MTSKVIEQVSFHTLLGDIDDKWMTLREKFQDSPQLAGQVNLRTPMEIANERKAKEPVSWWHKRRYDKIQIQMLPADLEILLLRKFL